MKNNTLTQAKATDSKNAIKRAEIIEAINEQANIVLESAKIAQAKEKCATATTDSAFCLYLKKDQAYKRIIEVWLHRERADIVLHAIDEQAQAAFCTQAKAVKNDKKHRYEIKATETKDVAQAVNLLLAIVCNK